ncbi:MAG: sugar ABC transporter substrate-binding protein [Candidatus Omnitrophica bacterium]|nr:sugar ABC transporter substrate-binding protein [Candidatus Omnitrophota bacterium]
MSRFSINKKPVVFFILTLITVFSLLNMAGCGTSSKQPVIKVAIWGGPDEIEIINKIIDEWQKGHPEAVAKIEHTPAGSYTNKLLIRIAGGTAPDVMFVESNIFVNFWAMDAFLDLKPYIESDTEFNVDDFFPEMIERFTKDGKTYCIPRDTAPFACVFYNKRLFDKAGIPYPADDWTWDDMLSKAKALTKLDENGRVAQYGFYGWTWQNFVYSNGGSIVDNVGDPREFTLGRPESIEGLQFYSDLINKHKVSPSPVEFGNLGMGAQQLFMSQKLAMYQSGFWESVMFGNIKDFDWDVAMFPKGPSGIRKFGTGGSGYCVLKSTKYPELAWSIVKALTSDKAQIFLSEMGLAQPALKPIALGPYFAGSDSPPKNKGMLNEAVGHVVFEPFHIKWREVNELYLSPKLDLVFNGTADVEEVIREATPKANKLLKERER